MDNTAPFTTSGPSAIGSSGSSQVSTGPLSTDSITGQRSSLWPSVQARSSTQSSNMASHPPSVFPYLTQLPVELQLSILKLSIIASEPSTLHLGFEREDNPPLFTEIIMPGTDVPPGEPISLNRRPVPAALQLCRMLRTTLFDSHKLSFKGNGFEDWEKTFYFDYEIDTLRFGPAQPVPGGSFGPLMTKEILVINNEFYKFTNTVQNNAFAQVKHLTLHHLFWGDQPCGLLHSAVLAAQRKWTGCFRNLAHLTILFSPYDPLESDSIDEIEAVREEFCVQTSKRHPNWSRTKWSYELMEVYPPRREWLWRMYDEDSAPWDADGPPWVGEALEEESFAPCCTDLSLGSIFNV